MSRNRRSDGDATKAKILDAAGNLIALHGFAQTSNKAIAQAAEVDLAAINYHFNGHDGLYKAVLIEAHAHYIDEQYLIDLVESALIPEEKLQQFFKTLIEKICDTGQWHSKVFIRELLSSSIHLQDFMQHEVARKLQLIQNIICQISGIDEQHPMLLPMTLSIVAPCMMLIIATSTNIPHSPLLPIIHLPPEQLARHFSQFALAGLQANFPNHIK